jgi:predicted GNAT family acetyltransferase
MTTDHSSGFSNNASRSRFELSEAGAVAFANYHLNGDVLTIPYVESPPALRGKGTAGRLMEKVAAHARQQNLKVLPICGYAVSWFHRHPENSDLLA